MNSNNNSSHKRKDLMSTNSHDGDAYGVPSRPRSGFGAVHEEMEKWRHPLPFREGILSSVICQCHRLARIILRQRLWVSYRIVLYCIVLYHTISYDIWRYSFPVLLMVDSSPINVPSLISPGVDEFWWCVSSSQLDPLWCSWLLFWSGAILEYLLR